MSAKKPKRLLHAIHSTLLTHDNMAAAALKNELPVSGVTHLALESPSAAVLQAPESPRVLTLMGLTKLFLDLHDPIQALSKWQWMISFPVDDFFGSSLYVSLICLHAATSLPPGPAEIAELSFATASMFHLVSDKRLREIKDLTYVMW